jgi:hypothetical protein
MMMSKTITEMTDDELYEEYDRLGRIYMYYQAAEGNWSRETAERNAAETEYFICQRELRNRGLSINV